MRYSDLQTEEERLAFVKTKLANDDRWVARGLLALFTCQTGQEKERKSTVKANGKGFSSYDAEMLTNIARELIRREGEHACNSLQKPFSLRNHMSAYHAEQARRRMPKYAKQLLEFAGRRKYPA